MAFGYYGVYVTKTRTRSKARQQRNIRLTAEAKRLVSAAQKQAFTLNRLELQFQPKLKVTCIQGACSLSECTIGDLVMSSASLGGQDEVGPVEHVEPLRLELHIYAFRKLEGLCQSHVSTHITWSDISITS